MTNLSSEQRFLFRSRSLAALGMTTSIGYPGILCLPSFHRSLRRLFQLELLLDEVEEGRLFGFLGLGNGFGDDGGLFADAFQVGAGGLQGVEHERVVLGGSGLGFEVADHARESDLDGGGVLWQRDAAAIDVAGGVVEVAAR